MAAERGRKTLELLLLNSGVREDRLAKILARYRHYSGQRFNRRSDRSRLVFLGALVASIGLLVLAAASKTILFLGDFNGDSAIFGGVAVAGVTWKIARRGLYADWMINGISYTGAGIVLCADQSLHKVFPFLLFCALFSSSALARVWIGLTAPRRAAAVWMIGSGGIGMLAVLCAILAWGAHATAAMQVAISLDTFLEGIAVAGFGAGLPQTPTFAKGD
jgi:uncharacterized membrane protein HdeD (DUF308 family)